MSHPVVLRCLERDQFYFINMQTAVPWDVWPSYSTFKATIYVQPMDREPLNFLYQCQWGLLGCQPWTGAKRYHSVHIATDSTHKPKP